MSVLLFRNMVTKNIRNFKFRDSWQILSRLSIWSAPSGAGAESFRQINWMLICRLLIGDKLFAMKGRQGLPNNKNFFSAHAGPTDGKSRRPFIYSKSFLPYLSPLCQPEHIATLTTKT